MRGLLVRQIPVRLLDLSLAGWCLESNREIAPGTTGDLRIDLGGAVYSDIVADLGGDGIRAEGRAGFSRLVSNRGVV